MNPRLVAIGGPLEGQSFALHYGPFRVGRGQGNDLSVPSAEVSRHHCEIQHSSEEGFVVEDLGSRHGVFVNARPVSRQALHHSDLLTVGTSIFLFLLDESGSHEVEGKAGSSRRPLRSTVTRWAAEGTVFAGPGLDGSSLAGSGSFDAGSGELGLRNRNSEEGVIDRVLPEPARIARGLQALLELSGALQAVSELRAVGACVVAALRRWHPGVSWSLWVEPEGVVGLESGEFLELIAPRDDSMGPDLVKESIAPPEDVAPPEDAVLALLQRRPGAAVELLLEGDGAASTAAATAWAAPLGDPEGAPVGLVYGLGPGLAKARQEDLELLATLAALTSGALQRARRFERVEGEARRLRRCQLRHDLVGESPAMEKVLSLVSRVARVESTVLVVGESGVGKELVAQAIHRSSERRSRPFVAINCATLSETLFESELFGHERGAFTGAVARAEGKIEAARGGTLFLDEVGEIPLALQAKLLRVLQEKSYTPVGSTRPRSADVRLIAATNRDLAAAKEEGSFREDLFYRLQVIQIEVPPLRQRRGDIPLLARHFLQRHGTAMGKAGGAFSSSALKALTAYSWPGNVRELGNVVERALVLGEGAVIEPEDLPEDLMAGEGGASGSYQEALEETKRRLITIAMAESGGDYGEAAERLGVHVNSLHRLIRRLEIRQRFTR
ncbi:MAG: sigma 54-interacting transcriptional regulator [Acidobacteriota bacterium]